MRDQQLGYCAMCNRQVLYVAAHGTSSGGGTRGEVLDPEPCATGKWHPTSDGSYRRADRQAKPGYKPHRCSRQPPSRWSREDVDSWYHAKMDRLASVRSAWCTEATRWCCRDTECLFGADDSATGFAIEQLLHERMAVRDRHYAWNTSPHRIADCYAEDAAAGSIPMVSLTSGGYDPQVVGEIAIGRYDQYWQQLFTMLAAHPRGFIRPWPAMNTPGSYGHNPSTYQRMWQRVYGVAVRAGAKLDWVWCPREHDPARLWRGYYPGDPYVDWIGLNLVDTTFNQAGPFRSYANEHHKPFAICQSGFTHGQPVVDPDTAIVYDKDGSLTGRSLIEKTMRDVTEHPNTAMFLVCNSEHGHGVSSSGEAVRQYQDHSRSARFRFGRYE